MSQKTTHIFATFTFLLFAQCAIVENDFCKNSGHLYGTHNYYDCTKNYDEDPIAFNHCTTVFNFTHESTEQNNCVEYTIPAIRKTFANERNLCTIEAEERNYAESMYPLSSIRLTLYDLSKHTSQQSIILDEAEAEANVNQHRKHYIHHCLSQKGWQKHFKFLSYDFDGLTWKQTHD